MAITWGLGLVLVGVALLVGGALTSKSNTRKKLFMVAFLVGGGALILTYLMPIAPFTGQINFGVGQPLTLTPEGNVVPVSSAVCPPGSVEDITATFLATDFFTGSATGGSHAYKRWLGSSWGPITSLADAGTATLSAGDKLQVLFGNASTSANYYGSLKEFTLPCGAGTYTATDKLYGNSSRTVTVFNEEKNSVGINQAEAIASGDVVTLDVEIKSVFQKGEPYGGVIVAEFNTSTYDDVIINLGGVKVDTPDVYRTQTGNTTRTYSIAPFTGTDKLVGSITLDAKSIEPTATVGNVTLTYYPNSFFIDEDAGSNFAGPSPDDEDAVATRLDVTTFVLSVS